MEGSFCVKKAICLLIALSLLLSLGACAANKPSSRPQEVVSGGGAIHFSSPGSGSRCAGRRTHGPGGGI